MQVEVRNGNLDRALRIMKKKLQDDGMFRELQTRQAYEKPSEKRKRKFRAAVVRAKKSERERAERIA